MDGEKKVKLYDGLELTPKVEPTAQDLQDLKELGIDLMNEGSYAVTIYECFLDMKEMKKMVDILFEGDIPKTIKPSVRGPVMEAAVRDFFAKFGLRFQS